MSNRSQRGTAQGGSGNSSIGTKQINRTNKAGSRILRCMGSMPKQERATHLDTGDIRRSGRNFAIFCGWRKINTLGFLTRKIYNADKAFFIAITRMGIIVLL